MTQVVTRSYTTYKHFFATVSDLPPLTYNAWAQWHVDRAAHGSIHERLQRIHPETNK